MKKISLARHELPYGVAEELKTLRTNMLFCGDEKRVVMLTSCISGEGKSTVSLELSRSLAELGKMVVLIDCDLRKSNIKHLVTDGAITAGVTHFLAGQCSADDALYQTETSGVFLMPAGAPPPNPSELLSGDRLTQLISSARKTYDYVVVDCAPLGMVVDAAVVAPRCDGAILVIEAGNIQYGFAKEVVVKLKNTRCPILGVVLNKVDDQHEKYYGYGKGKYGKYYSKRYEEYYQNPQEHKA